MVREGQAGLEYLLLTNRQRDEPGFAKGHTEPGESELETAIRETEEETQLTDFEPVTAFRRELHYPAERKGQHYDKTVVYFLARHRSGEVVLSDEHSAFSWAPLAEAIDTLPFDSLVHIVREAALWLKDPALFDIEPATQQDALDHLTAQPQITDPLVRHLQGGAHLARFFAEALREAGIPIHVEAAAAGTILHDIGRARGDHEDHQRAGLKYLRTGTLAPYAFACVSHFTKGAPSDALVAAGVDPAMLEEVGGLVDLSSLTWEEKCAALADGCMRGDRAAPPADRYADLRTRYDADELITLQERYTETIRAEIESALGQDPLALAGLA